MEGHEKARWALGRPGFEEKLGGILAATPNQAEQAKATEQGDRGLGDGEGFIESAGNDEIIDNDGFIDAGIGFSEVESRDVVCIGE